MKLFKALHDIWSGIKEFLSPATTENFLDPGSILWQMIFKDTTWINYAMETYQCSLVLVGHSLSSYHPQKSSAGLYLALIANDCSGELRYKTTTFFATLQDGWKYNEDKYEVYLPSGVTLNVYDIVNGHEEVELPLEKIFNDSTKGIYTEYCYYGNPAIRETQPSDIIRWDPNYRTHPHARLGWWNGFACNGRDLIMGCQLALFNRDIRTVYVILPRHGKDRLWAKTAGRDVEPLCISRPDISMHQGH